MLYCSQKEILSFQSGSFRAHFCTLFSSYSKAFGYASTSGRKGDEEENLFYLPFQLKWFLFYCLSVLPDSVGLLPSWTFFLFPRLFETMFIFVSFPVPSSFIVGRFLGKRRKNGIEICCETLRKRKNFYIVPCPDLMCLLFLLENITPALTFAAVPPDTRCDVGRSLSSVCLSYLCVRRIVFFLIAPRKSGIDVSHTHTPRSLSNKAKHATEKNRRELTLSERKTLSFMPL